VGFNPFRNERDAFRVLLYVLAAFAVAMIVIFAVRAAT
jgi:hypothetical protein